jgi:hypothetical protein
LRLSALDGTATGAGVLETAALALTGADPQARRIVAQHGPEGGVRWDLGVGHRFAFFDCAAAAASTTRRITLDRGSCRLSRSASIASTIAGSTRIPMCTDLAGSDVRFTR